MSGLLARGPAHSLVLHPCTAAMRREQLGELAINETGFLDCDPRVQPVDAMLDRLDRHRALLFAGACGEQGEPGSAGLVGFVPNVRQGSQWVLDVVPAAGVADGAWLVAEAATFAATFLAARSLVRYGQVRDRRGVLFEAAGFVRLGRLRAALYEDGAYRDQPVWFLGEALTALGEAVSGGGPHASDQ